MADEPIDRINRPLGKMMWHNFMGGIAWGLGVTLGLSILFGTLGYLGSKVDWVPVIGKFVNDITKSLDVNRPQVAPPQRRAQ